ncbi:hypothetical protein ABIC63_000550 [Pseudacidovorax sp. 1753]|uniref:hypothetical protein n=1 Tax=Pseudacidovorax sp. 1753 TaxID=3156419 RepID=UPI00339B9B9D
MKQYRRTGLQWHPENLLRPGLADDYEAGLIRRGHWSVCLRLTEFEVQAIQANTAVSLAPPRGVKHRILGPGLLISPHYALRLATEHVMELPDGFYVSAFTARVDPPHEIGVHLLAPREPLRRFVEARKVPSPPGRQPAAAPASPTTPAPPGVFRSEDP